MITDNKRREVAKELRKQLRYMRENDMYEKDIDALECGNRTYRNIAYSVEDYGNFNKGNYANIVELLADLIDRPTCHIIETDHEFEDSVRCDRCRTTFNRPWEPFKYCPNCGAEVVDDARI